MDRSTHYPRSWSSYFVVGLASLLASLAARADDGAHPCNKRDFRIPYNIVDNGQGLVGIYLYVSQDQGKTYTFVPGAAASPATPADRRYFVFHAPSDGVYWFVVQTRDSTGAVQPIDPRLVQPSLKVHVDTQAPQIVQLNQVTGKDGGGAAAPLAVEWLINDDGFASLSLDYRAQGTGDWYPVPDAVQSARATQVLAPVITGPLDVRLRVQDKGGNFAERIIQVTGSSRQGALPPAQAQAESGSGQIHYVNSKTFQLNFQIEEASMGPSGIKQVDIWFLRRGQWQKHEKPITAFTAPQTSHPFKVENEGRWGFTLVPVSGVGLSGPTPKPGDPPQTWVEVDLTKPVVQIREAPVVGQGPDAGFMTITWSASDTFLRPEPITISYREKENDKWEPLPKAPDRLPNTGSYRASTQGLPYQFYLQVKAVDEAGNEGTAVTAQPVKVDLQVPRIKSLEARPPAVGSIEVRPGGSSW
jgi:hypothetical protein